MRKKIELSIDKIIAEIKITDLGIKKTKLTNDKLGYGFAFKRHEGFTCEYDHILYREREPTLVF